MQRRYCIALTGGLASGKSTVADLFAARGITVVDTDRIAHALTGIGGPAIPDIVDTFGQDILKPDGSLDRAGLRQTIFSTPALRKKLEAILHPRIREAAVAAASAANGPYVLLVVPLLAETWPLFSDSVDRILAVDCAEDLQLHRAMARDAMDEALARDILAAQAVRQQRLALADDVILNSGSREELDLQVGLLHDRYLSLAKKHADALP